MLKSIGISVLVLFGALASGNVMADRDGHHGGHVRFGLSLGVPLFGPGYYSPYYGYPYPAYAYPYAYPPVVVQSSPPPVYIEQSPAQAAPAPAQADWYYCAASNSYYPYVSECPAGWQRVPSQPPAR